MNKHFLLALILLVFSCGKTENKESVQNNSAVSQKAATDPDFTRFLSLLPKVSLPFEATCDNCCVHPVVDYENELIKRFTPAGSRIVGLVRRNQENAVILVTYPADIVFPSIKVYDLTGKLLDEESLMTNYCGADFEFLGKQSFRINADYSITAIDTSYHFKMDTVSYEIIDTVKIDITEKKFMITEAGSIIENN